MINQKTGTANLLECKRCHDTFCYICNKPVADNSHYVGNGNCKEQSNAYDDL